ncbi:MAG TPA: winged helix-turn-helix domain-containing protein [Terriglobales bacterium]|jgi:DNA-binding response OmpR family regulator
MTTSPSAMLQAAENISNPELLLRSLELEAIQSADGQSLLGTFPPVDADSYQIALVPVQSGREWNRTRGHEGELDGLLLLPLTWKELITRVFNEIGGSHSLRPNEIANFGQVRIDLRSMEVVRSDRPVKLTAMEFKVLRFFLFNQKRVISRDELLNEVWGYENYPCTRTVDNHVLKLRQKLEPDPAHPIYFRTAHGIGYRFVP